MENDSGFIKKVYLASLFPNLIAVLGGTINVFFDGILVGQKLGEIGLSAVSQSLPIYLVLCTIGSLFASGAACVSSIAIGESDRENGQRIFRAALWTAAGAGILFSVIGLVFIDPLTALLSSKETFSTVKTYVSVTLIGGVTKVLLYLPFFYLRMEGKNRRSAAAMLTMTALNIILDFVFLFVFDAGIAGAAWASVIATTVACAMSFLFLFTDHPNFTLGFAFFKGKDWVSVAKYGSPMALNNVLSSARILVLNLILKSMSSSGFVAVFAVINNINEFSICIQNGVPQTAGAMTGIFFGERDSFSVKKLLDTQLKAGVALSASFSAILCLFSRSVGRLFGSEADCTAAVICFAVSLLFATTNSVLTYYYNATGRIRSANVITICRGFLLTVLFCFVFSYAGNFVWLFYPLSEIATLLTVYAIGRKEAEKNGLTPFYLLDESFEKEGHCVSFSVDCSDEMICSASANIRDFCEENGFTSKKTMAISLAIEEILSIIAHKSLGGYGKMDVRVISSSDEAILRVRSGGERYNPLEKMSDDPDYMGVRMITKLAKKAEYLSSLGLNTLIIYL